MTFMSLEIREQLTAGSFPPPREAPTENFKLGCKCLHQQFSRVSHDPFGGSLIRYLHQTSQQFAVLK